MKVKSVLYNWHQVKDSESADENYSILEVGKRGVASIEEFLPRGEGDKWSYLINYEDGHVLRIFNSNLVEYFPDEVEIDGQIDSGLHLICGNCGCNGEWSYEISEEERDEEEILCDSDVFLICNNCATLHSLNDSAKREET